MDPKSLQTNARNTWCPGCGNFAVLNAVKSVLADLSAENIGMENIVLVSGIGCNSKIVDYINVNSFYSLHGRDVAAAEGIKLGNPGLKVIVFAGDGDAYGEGLEHLLFAAKRNIDITLIVHNNRVYGLTTGQYTPTSPEGFKGRSTPKGNIEEPFNPLHLVLAGGGTFIGRAYTHGLDLLKKVLKEAVAHKGFSYVDVLQVCVTFNDMYDYYSKRVYELKDHDPLDYGKAMAKIMEWDYNSDKPIALGVFYKKMKPSYDERRRKTPSVIDRDKEINGLLSTLI